MGRNGQPDILVMSSSFKCSLADRVLKPGWSNRPAGLEMSSSIVTSKDPPWTSS